MFKKEQIENKISNFQKPSDYTAFGMIPAAILTTQTLARFKFENKNESTLNETQKRINGLSKNFI